MKTIKIENPKSTIKLTKDQALKLGIDTTKESIKGDLKTQGPWNIAKSFKALCISNKYDKESIYPKKINTTFYGSRTMTNVKNSGYELEGYVSILGKKYTCFTSSILLEVEGKIIDINVIVARIK